MAESSSSNLWALKFQEGKEGKTGAEGKEGKPAPIGVPSAATKIKTGEEIEPSATKVSTVYLSLILKAEKSAWEIIVDSKPVYVDAVETLVAADLNQTYFIRVKATGKYEVKMVEGAATEVHAVIQEG